MVARYAALGLSFLVIGLLIGCAGVGNGGAGSSDGGATGPGDLLVGGPADLTPAPPDLTPPRDLRGLKNLGDNCTIDTECTTGLCRPLGPQGASICVAGCKKQADCSAVPGTFCSPKAAGAADGYCVGNSPSHCQNCLDDSECGALFDRCLTGPGDNAAACHIDCSLSGAAACPADYDCTAVPDGAGMRQLCVPRAKFCLDSYGGFCDRTALPQPCTRTNTAGVCTGSRQCLGLGRFDKCSALAPQFKLSCSQLDPAGCTLAYAPGAVTTKDNCGSCGHACATSEDCCGGTCTSIVSVSNCGSCGKVCAPSQGCCNSACTSLATVSNCGACGNACPGQGLANNDVFCQDVAKKLCGQTCRGENYDVDNSLANGCESSHPTPPGHSEATASDRGHKSCYDGASTDDFSNPLLSDSRVHMNPTVDGFKGTVGSAPDYWIVEADGGAFCVDDYSVTLTTSYGGDTACYTATIITNKMTQSVTVNGHGSATISHGSGAYSDGTNIYFKIEKTCSLPVQESVSYAIHYHL